MAPTSSTTRTMAIAQPILTETFVLGLKMACWEARLSSFSFAEWGIVNIGISPLLALVSTKVAVEAWIYPQTAIGVWQMSYVEVAHHLVWIGRHVTNGIKMKNYVHRSRQKTIEMQSMGEQGYEHVHSSKYVQLVILTAGCAWSRCIFGERMLYKLFTSESWSLGDTYATIPATSSHTAPSLSVGLPLMSYPGRRLKPDLFRQSSSPHAMGCVTD